MSSTISANESTSILVTGSHRSGTTWVGKMLAADAHTAYIGEPLNVMHRPGVYGTPVKYWYTYISDENSAVYLPAFKDLSNFRYRVGREIARVRSFKEFLSMGRDIHTFSIARMYGQRALIKDPFAVFSAPWFAKRLHFRVVITVRHPGRFAGSLKRLGWKFDFGNFLNQPHLMHDHLEADRAAMESAPKDDIIGQAALLWKIIYRFVDHTRSEFPRFHIVRHEDFSADPVGSFQALYKELGLNFTERVKDIIRNSSSSENPAKLARNKTHSVQLDSRANLDNWKEILSPDEIARVRNITDDVAEAFYSEEEWK